MSDDPHAPRPDASEEPLAEVMEDEEKGLPALLWGSALCLGVVILVAYLLLQ